MSKRKYHCRLLQLLRQGELSMRGASDALKTFATQMSRPCSSEEPRECWICFELPSWNNILNPLGLNLSETEPGKLTLATFKPQQLKNILDPESPLATCSVFFMAWLPRKHRCLHFLVVDRDLPRVASPVLELLTETKFGTEDRCHLRHIKWAAPTENWEVLGFFQMADCLEELDVSFGANVNAVPTQVSHLLQLSASCVKTLNICVPLHRLHTPKYRYQDPCPSPSELDVTAACTECVPQVVARHLSSGTNAVSKLTLFYPRNRCGHREFIQALRSDSRLKEVHLVSDWSEAFTVFCEAVLGHSGIRRLTLTAQFPQRGMPLPAGSVASLLYEDAALKELALANFAVTSSDSEIISAALRGNSTLNFIDFLGSAVDFAVATEMAKALNKNDSLKRLRMQRIKGSALERQAFASLFGSIGCSGRLEMLEWQCDDMVTLSPLLAAPSIVPKDVLVEIDWVDPPAATALREALGGSNGAPLRNLGLQVLRQWPDDTRDAVCCILDSNTSLEALEIIEDTCDEEFPGVFRNLMGMSAVVSQSSRLAQISVLNAEQLDDAYAKWLGPILEKNESIVQVALCQRSDEYFPEDTFEMLAGAFLRNKYVVEIRVECLFQDSKEYGLSRTVTRNRTLLNDAVRFVTGTDESPRCARACEALATKHSLLRLLQKVTGAKKDKARGAIRAALGRISERFLIFTGVVKSSVSCRPAQVTQVDALNADCWRAIGRYLKLSDVATKP